MLIRELQHKTVEDVRPTIPSNSEMSNPVSLFTVGIAVKNVEEVPEEHLEILEERLIEIKAKFLTELFDYIEEWELETDDFNPKSPANYRGAVSIITLADCYGDVKISDSAGKLKDDPDSLFPKVGI